MMAKKTGSEQEESSAVWRASGMGVEFASAIVGMALLGWLIDNWQGTEPWGVLSGLVLGIVGGGYNFLKQAMRMNRDAVARFRTRHPDGFTPEPFEEEKSENDGDDDEY